MFGLLLGAGVVFGARALLDDDTPDGSASSVIEPSPLRAAPGVMPDVPANAPLPARDVSKAVEPLVQLSATETHPGDLQSERLAGILVHGLLTDRAGAGLDLAEGHGELRFTSASGLVCTARCAPSGSYAVSNLQPGEWRVHLAARGCVDLDRSLTLTAEEPVRRCDFVVDTVLTLLVSAFTPDGVPLRDVLKEQMPRLNDEHAFAVVATRAAPGSELSEPRNGFDRYGIGRFRDGSSFFDPEPDLPRGALGRLEVHEALPAFVSLLFRGAVLGSQSVAPGAEAVTFTVPRDFLDSRRGGLRLRIVDAATAAPLPDARALLTETNEYAFEGGLAPDATGTITWQGEPPGLRRLQVDCSEHEQYVAMVKVPAGDVADLGTVALDIVAHISGVVRDAHGVPQVATLQMLRTDGPVPVRIENMIISSNPDGSFRWDDLGRREYELRVSPDDWAAQPVPVTTRAGSVEGLVVIVERGTEVVFDRQWPATQELDVEFRADDGGLAMLRHPLWGAETMTRRMLAGDYEALLFDGPQLVREIPFRVEGQHGMVALAP